MKNSETKINIKVLTIALIYRANSEAMKLKSYHVQINNSVTNSTENLVTESDIQEANVFNMIVYSGLIIGLLICSKVRSWYQYSVAIKASESLHNSMFGHIIRAPCRFFDTNPVGRVLNRFSKDMGSVDENLPPVMLDVASVRSL